MKRVLVTGGTGFVGRHTLAHLARLGYEVHATCQDRTLAIAGVHWHQSNLLDPRARDHLTALVAPSHLLHLAWYTEHGKFWESPLNLEWTAASLQLLRRFHENGGMRVVIAGTCAEYEWGAPVLSESSTPIAPRTLYGKSKNALRLAAESFVPGVGLSFAWARLFMLYGPFEDPARFVPATVNKLLRGETAHCLSGNHRRDYLHSSDAADAIVSVLASPVEGVVNIGSGEAVKMSEIAQLIMSITKTEGLLRVSDAPDTEGNPASLVADIQRLRTEVGWGPRIGLKEGLSDTVHWWRARLSKRTA